VALRVLSTQTLIAATAGCPGVGAPPPAPTASALERQSLVLRFYNNESYFDSAELATLKQTLAAIPPETRELFFHSTLACRRRRIGNSPTVAALFPVRVKLKTDFRMHVCFGWAPLSKSDNGFWEPFQVKIMQNSVDLVDNAPIVYLFAPNGNAEGNDDKHGSHFCQYTPEQPDWFGKYWADHKSPLFYRTVEDDFHGPLVARQSCRGQHMPESGYIVSAESPKGPWFVRAKWTDQLRFGGGWGNDNKDFLDTPLNTEYNEDDPLCENMAVA